MLRPLHVAMIGTNFMGKAHSNAWTSVGQFFDLPREVVLDAVISRSMTSALEMVQRWGWERGLTDLKEAVADDRINLIDICTPNHLHREHALLALKHGKHVACEKPLAGTLQDARAMRAAARRARESGVHTFVWFNYRRCPAIAHAHRLIAQNRLGRIYHVRAAYLQDWAGPDTPFSWRFHVEHAGSGAHGDLNTHIIDLARFLTGDEIVAVHGAVAETFIKQRRDDTTGRMRRSTVDDCAMFLVSFKNGATGSFEASRLATGSQNRSTIEINGEKGSVKFDFERMNELQWWDNTLKPAMRGWSRILCTTPGEHPYMDAYWPPGHLIGYEHGFVSQASDMIRVLSGRKPVVPLADFDDAYETHRVLEAAMVAAREGRRVKLSEVQ